MICPFCEAKTAGNPCEGCGRDTTARRRACPKCHKMSPFGEATCCHCGHEFRNEMRWKIPAIIVMFVAATAAAVAVELFIR